MPACYDVLLEPDEFWAPLKLMQERIYRVTFVSVALAATAGWVWLLYHALNWVTGI
jgi:hypothetical protein